MAYKKTKVLMGVTLSETGGAQKIVYDIIKSLPPNYAIKLVTSPGGNLVKSMGYLKEKDNIDVEVIELDTLVRHISPIKDVKSLFQIYKILKTGNYDIAHFHSSKMGIMGPIASKLAKVPKIFFTVHGWGINQDTSTIARTLLNKILRISCKVCTQVICVSEHDYQKGISHKWVKDNNAVVIKNGVQPTFQGTGKLKKILRFNEDDVVIGTVIRLAVPKDPLFTIQVFNEVLKLHPHVKLVIVGDGCLKEECIKLVQNCNLDDSVFLMGDRDDARELINDIDIFVLFSHWEGLPVSILEAMSAGKLIVANKVGGIPELVETGVNGYLLDDFNITSAKNIISRLVINATLRNKLGRNSKEKSISDFTLERMVGEYISLYIK